MFAEYHLSPGKAYVRDWNESEAECFGTREAGARGSWLKRNEQRESVRRSSKER